jgi:tetratricopeptide (TPR) repeat protein
MNARSRPGHKVPIGRMTVRERFALALQHHQAGRLAEAEPLYRQILAVEPRHDESLHLLGVIYCQCGRADIAVELIEQAIVLRGDVAPYQYNLGMALQQLGRPDAAIARFERAVALKPDYVEAHNNLAVLQLTLGRFVAATAQFERALALKPDHVEAGCNLGVALLQQGRLDAAIARFRQVLALRPDYPEAHCNLGSALERQGRVVEAVAAFENALALRPDYPEALQSVAALLHQLGRLEESAARYERAVELRPEHAESWYGLGCTRHRQERRDAAAACYDKAIALRPDYPEAYSNLSLIRKDQGDMNAALEVLDRALALRPDFADAQLNQAMIHLLTGNLRTGWRQYEARWRTSQLDPDRREFAIPRWDGGAGDGRTLLVWAEQGLGDSLQFCRYVPLLVARGWHVVVEVPDSLVRLLQGLAGATVLPIGGAADLVPDCHCPMMSLPLLFETALDTVPAQVPYLAPSSGTAPALRLADAGDAVKIGLVWAGNPGKLSALHAAVDTRRSIVLERLAPLLAVPGTRFISLQKDHRPSEDPAAYGILDPMPAVQDFADTATIIDQLDLVIAVDTSVVHLAGAMGKPVWLLNRFDTCWRWLQARDDSPWYPTLRQFRQPRLGDWDSVIAEAAGALAALVAARHGAANR